VHNIIATVGTLRGFLVYFQTTMRTGNKFFNLIIREADLSVVPPGLFVPAVVPTILGDNHNKHRSGFSGESPTPPGILLPV
jgi:hypothetical protein